MMLRIDPHAARPPYEQLREQLMAQIRQGQLSPGTTLPPVRRLASDLGLAPNTVARAYRELEAAGAVKGRGRRGTFVLQEPTAQAAEQLTQNYLASMAALGHTDDDALAWVRRLRRS